MVGRNVFNSCWIIGYFRGIGINVNKFNYLDCYYCGGTGCGDMGYEEEWWMISKMVEFKDIFSDDELIQKELDMLKELNPVFLRIEELPEDYEIISKSTLL